MPSTNQFSLYNPYSRGTSDNQSYITNPSDISSLSNFDNRPVFTGSDLHAYINNVHVGNIESLTYSTNREVVGVYAMGNASPINFAKGKRMVVGSMMFAQFDAHAVMEGVFKLQTRTGGPVDTVGALWKDLSSPDQGITNTQFLSQTIASNSVVQGLKGAINTSTTDVSQATLAGIGLQGLSQSDYQKQVKAQVNRTLQIVAGESLLYPDQLPAFDLTLVGVNELGFVSKFALLGVTITQETGGWSLADLQNNIGLTYVARQILYWRSASGGTGTGN